jgi:hypothetical protein
VSDREAQIRRLEEAVRVLGNDPKHAEVVKIAREQIEWRKKPWWRRWFS